MKRFIYLIAIFSTLNIFAQNRVDSLIAIRNTMLKTENDQLLFSLNNVFRQQIIDFLNSENSYTIKLDSIKNIGDLYSPDNSFRLITWNLPAKDGTHTYYCFLQKPNGEFIEFIDLSDKITQPEKRILDNTKWFGCLYYEIIPYKKKNKQYYTLLGWDGNNVFSSKKIIDVLYFDKEKVKFGLPIFKTEKKTQRRVIFEHSAEAVMSLKYYKKKKQIIFDHLSPISDDVKGIYQFYVPDMSFDALELKKGKWEYQPDIDIRLEKDNKIFNQPK